MNKWVLFVCIFFIGAGTEISYAQRDLENVEKPSFRDRVYFGGGGIFQLNQHYFVIGASPLMGYMITPRLSSGVGATYQFTRYKFIAQSAHTYGGRLFTRYNIFPAVYTMAEYEMLRVALPRISSELPRAWVDRLLLGGGYYQAFPGRRGGFNLGIFYDVLFQYGPNRNGPYSSPWVYRVGFTL